MEWKDLQIVYRRYASLIIVFATSREENELLTLEIIHRYVEILDSYFEKAHFLLDEFMIAGEMIDTGKHSIMKYVKYA